MNKLTTDGAFLQKNLFDSMLRHAIGYDPRFFERVADAPNFPPHNIYEIADGVYRLTLAVAGFTRDELELELHNDILTVSGKKAPADDDGSRLLYRGIAMRDFSRQFKLGEHVQVDAVTLDHGMLVVDLSRHVPESLKPKRIPIAH